MIYLDNASTTKIDPIVLESMMPYLTEQYGNPGSLYTLGADAKKAVDKAREQVADLIGAYPRQIVFTSGGSEANSLVFGGIENYLAKTGRTHIVVSQTEHDSVLKAAENISMKAQFYAGYVPPEEDGVVTPHSVRNGFAYRDGSLFTGLVSVMHVNNETGAENDVEAIGELCGRHGILFHTDCVQAASCCPIDVEKINCDFLSLSSHKLHGPKGVGALFVSEPERLSPLIHGGAFQEFGLRGGTENVAGIVGFGKACELTKASLHDDDVHTSTLKQVFYNNLIQFLSEAGMEDVVHVNGGLVIRHGRILNLRFDGVDGETLLLLLDRMGVCVSAGSACNSREQVPSHVLVSMGLSDEQARGSVRVSFSRENTEEEAITAARIIADCVSRLRSI